MKISQCVTGIFRFHGIIQDLKKGSEIQFKWFSARSTLILLLDSNNNNLLLTPKMLLQSCALFDYPLLRLQQVFTPLAK